MSTTFTTNICRNQNTVSVIIDEKSVMSFKHSPQINGIGTCWWKICDEYNIHHK